MIRKFYMLSFWLAFGLGVACAEADTAADPGCDVGSFGDWFCQCRADGSCNDPDLFCDAGTNECQWSCRPDLVGGKICGRCHIGGPSEGACKPSFEGDGYCDCGCQFDDAQDCML